MILLHIAKNKKRSKRIASFAISPLTSHPSFSSSFASFILSITQIGFLKRLQARFIIGPEANPLKPWKARLATPVTTWGWFAILKSWLGQVDKGFFSCLMLLRPPSRSGQRAGLCLRPVAIKRPGAPPAVRRDDRRLG